MDDDAIRIRCLELALQVRPEYGGGGMVMSPKAASYHDEDDAVSRARTYYDWITNAPTAEEV